MKYLIGRANGKWIIGKPKPVDLQLEKMSLEIDLTDKIWDRILNGSELDMVFLLLEQEYAECLIKHGKFTEKELLILAAIAQSLNNKQNFFRHFVPIYQREGGWSYDIYRKVSIFWFYERVLIEEGLRRHGRFVKKQIKKIHQDNRKFI